MKKRLQLLILVVFCIQLNAQDVPLKRLYLGNDTHVDLMYNGTEEKWAKLILEMGDFYLNLGESSKNEEPNKRSKWNYDCAYWLWVFEHQTTPEYFQRIIAQIKNQQASVPYNFTLPIYGASTAESVIRSFYYSGYLERKYGIDVDIAVCQENATIPLGLASLFNGSGAKYSWKGVCNCASKTKTIGQRKHEIYWNTGLDSSKILMKWYSNAGWNAELGGYAEMLEPTIAVMQMDTLCGSKRYPYRIAGAFGKGWDNMVNYAYDLQWGVNHRTRPGTKVFLSNELDFFNDFEKTYGNQLPSETAAYGNEWDLLPATLMNVSGGIRRSMEKLRSAEAMAAIVSSENPKAFDHLKAIKTDAFYAISTISAHGWTIDGPITKCQFADWARKQLKIIELYTNTLYEDALKLMSENAVKMPKTRMGSGLEKQVQKPFIVFNPLNWERSDMADLRVENAENTTVFDAQTGKKINTQIIEKDGKKHLRFYAQNIPSVGYKVYEIKENKDNSKQKLASDAIFKFKDNVLETPFYTVKLTIKGEIISLIDKKTKREFAKNINGKYLNTLSVDTPKIAFNNEGMLRVENNGEESITLQAQGNFPLKFTTKITFYRHQARIDFDNQINENFGAPAYWSYSFNVENPTVWHEEVGAVVKAKYEKEGGHYADEMSRVDHLSLNHFADVADAQGGVTLSDADCLFMKLGNSELQKLDSKSSQINVLAGGQIDANFNLGIIKQDGDSVFHQHFSLLPHAAVYNQTTAMKFSLEHQNPLITNVLGIEKISMPPQYSFLKTDNSDLLLWSLKPAEEGENITARFWHTGLKPTEASLIFDKNIKRAQEATHVETPMLDKIPVNNTLKIKAQQQQMRTYLIGF